MDDSYVLISKDSHHLASGRVPLVWRFLTPLTWCFLQGSQGHVLEKPGISRFDAFTLQNFHYAKEEFLRFYLLVLSLKKFVLSFNNYLVEAQSNFLYCIYNRTSQRNLFKVNWVLSLFNFILFTLVPLFRIAKVLDFYWQSLAFHVGVRLN